MISNPQRGYYAFDDIFSLGYYLSVEWDIEYTDEFGAWWDGLTEGEQESVRASVRLLGDFGPGLRFPHSSGIAGPRRGNMRELRFSMLVDRIAYFTPLILAVAPSC